MNSKTIVAVLVLIAVVAVGWWVLKVGPVVAPPAPQTDPGPLTGSTTPDGNYEYTENAQYYTVDIKYPSQTLLTDRAADTKARQNLETSLKVQLDQFKQSVEGLDASVLPSLADGHKLEFTAEYKTYTSTSTNTVSYFYTLFEDTGGAHPNTYFQTSVFNQQGNVVALSDLLSKNPNWLEELSLVVSNSVVAQYKVRASVDDTTGLIFADGLAPKAENFQDFFVDGDTLVIEIPTYQAAAYVAGSFEVRIPLSSIDH